MKINVYVHIYHHDADALARLEERIMSEFTDIQDMLTALGAAITDISGDITALMAALPTGGLTADETAQLKADLAGKVAALQAAAAVYPPAPPTP